MPFLGSDARGVGSRRRASFLSSVLGYVQRFFGLPTPAMVVVVAAAAAAEMVAAADTTAQQYNSIRKHVKADTDCFKA